MKKIIIKKVIIDPCRFFDQVSHAFACPIIRIWQHVVQTCAYEYSQKIQSTQTLYCSRVFPYLQCHSYWGISIGKKSLGTFGYADPLQQSTVPGKGTLSLVDIFHYFERVWTWLPEDICWHFQIKMDLIFCGCAKILKQPSSAVFSVLRASV